MTTETDTRGLTGGLTPERLPDRLYLVATDLGGVRSSIAADTLRGAYDRVKAMPEPQGYSSHSATLYKWKRRAVDGKPYLHRLGYWHFGKLVRRVPGPTESMTLTDTERANVGAYLKADSRAQNFAAASNVGAGLSRAAKCRADALYDVLTGREREAVRRLWRERS